MVDIHAQFKEVLETLNEAKRILLCCHLGPDADSVGANLAAKEWLESKGKKVTIISPDRIPENLDYLNGVGDIQEKKLEEVDQKKVDLFLSLDSAAWTMLSRGRNADFWKKPIVAIDHHFKSERFTNKWVFVDCSSTCEILVDLFNYDKFRISQVVGQQLLTGIYADTLGFKVDSVSPKTFAAVAKLIESGGKIAEVAFNLERRVSIEKIAYWSVYLKNLQINKKYKYCWTTVTRKQSMPDDKIDGEPKTTSLFLPIVSGTDFGFSLRESDSGVIYGSLRSRTDVDVSIIARALGGGGHKRAAAFRFDPKTSMEKAVEKVHQIIKEKRAEIKN
jgi:phosphoesterase RecJ-like protein